MPEPQAEWQGLRPSEAIGAPRLHEPCNCTHPCPQAALTSQRASALGRRVRTAARCAKQQEGDEARLAQLGAGRSRVQRQAHKHQQRAHLRVGPISHSKRSNVNKKDKISCTRAVGGTHKSRDECRKEQTAHASSRSVEAGHSMAIVRKKAATSKTNDASAWATWQRYHPSRHVGGKKARTLPLACTRLSLVNVRTEEPSRMERDTSSVSGNRPEAWPVERGPPRRQSARGAPSSVRCVHPQR